MSRTITYLILISLLFSSGCGRNANNYFKLTGYTQGTTYNITYCDRDTLGNKIHFTPDDIQFFISESLTNIDNTISGYNKGSILSKINNNIDCDLNPIFEEIFNISQDIHKLTDGFVDISGGPLFDLWGFGFKAGIDPCEEDINSAMTLIGMDKIKIVGNKVVKDTPSTQLNFNAIAPGYSCDLIGRLLENKGITDYLIEIGGEVLCKGNNPNRKDWTIGIDTPTDGNNDSGKDIKAIISVSDIAVVTSGNYRKYYIKDGKKYSHSINPKTGRPVSHNLLSATILAKTAALADGYATYCMVIGLEESIKFFDSHPEIEGYLIYGEQENMKVFCTPKLEKTIRQK